MRRSRLIPLLLATVWLTSLAYSAGDEEDPAFTLPTREPSQVVGYMECAKCHVSEVQQWKRTPHHLTYSSLHRTPEAKAILKKLGLRTAKRNDTCIKCHYTQKLEGVRVRAVSGVSCESCHGAAKNWIKVHADYGGEGINRDNESPAHRQHRLETSIAAGMNNPSNLYLIAQQCFSCHTVPDESLVNVGGHRPGSHDFELVSWSQGIVRHNFVRSGGHTNAPSSKNRLRVMYVVGIMTDLEYSLRATARATTKSTYGITSAKRAASMKRRLRELQDLIDDPYVQRALQAVSTVKLTLNNSKALLTAADRVGRAALQFADHHDGSQLAAIDAELPDPRHYRN